MKAVLLASACTPAQESELPPKKQPAAEAGTRHSDSGLSRRLIAESRAKIIRFKSDFGQARDSLQIRTPEAVIILDKASETLDYHLTQLEQAPNDREFGRRLQLLRDVTANADAMLQRFNVPRSAPAIVR